MKARKWTHGDAPGPDVKIERWDAIRYTTGGEFHVTDPGSGSEMRFYFSAAEVDELVRKFGAAPTDRGVPGLTEVG